MPAWPDAASVRDGLARVWRRLALVAMIDGVTAGLVVAAVLLVLGWRAAWPPRALAAAIVLPVLLGGIRAFLRSRRAQPLTAERLEQRAPACRNVVVTADQILRRQQPVRDDIGARVCRDAAAHLAALDPATLFPAGRSLARLAAAAAIASALTVVSIRHTGAQPSAPVDLHAAAISHIELRLTPPAYIGAAPETLRDPKTLSVIAGTRIDVSVVADAAGVTLETAAATETLHGLPGGTFTGTIAPAADGFLGLQPVAGDGTAGPKTLIGLTVVPDRAPFVRITVPGRDLMLPAGDRKIDITIDATDDLGLDALRLEYTRVTGSGESFEFKKGEVPVTVARTSAREWRATASWPLGPLALQPGDMVVYRGVAADKRPGATPVESDALIIEIAAPGSVAAEGFAMDDQHDRYALSQRMVIVKTERLLAKRAGMTKDDILDESLGIAAEQRSVRAEFIFMMGGELEGAASDASDLNEEAEAAGEADLLAGRARNRGRIDLLIATRNMSEAATSLTTADFATALPAEKAALDALQRAFAKDRYLLRTFANRERPDPTRRMTGALKDLAADRRPADAPADDPRAATLRRALTTLGDLAGRTAFTRDDAALATVAGDNILRLDPASSALRDIATDLNAASASITAGRADEARPRLAHAATALSATLAADLPSTPSPDDDARTRRLRGAMADAPRKAGRR